VFNDKERPEAVREGAIRLLISIDPATTRLAIHDLVDFLEAPKTSTDLRHAAIAALTK
jgi:hypothetical protein